MQGVGRWYAPSTAAASEVGPLELDLILLSLLRAARSMRDDPRLMQRLGQRVPALLEVVDGLARHQVLVDEATDFSPLQLGCMAQLVTPRVDSFFACGDFNQRLTSWGSRSISDLRWLLPDVQLRHVHTAYRQSRRLTEFAVRLAATPDSERPNTPEFIEHEGVAPALGRGLNDSSALASWLSSRIREVERLSGAFPSIAVLVQNKAELDPLARALSEALADVNLRATACPDGQALGAEGDVRIFEAEHQGIAIRGRILRERG